MRSVRSVKRRTQIVVLAAVELGTQASDAFDEVAPVGREMARVHARQERIGRPIGLEVRVRQAAAVVDLVFVGVDHVGVGMPFDEARDLEEGVRGEEIVVIEKRDELRPSRGRAPNSTRARCAR